MKKRLELKGNLYKGIIEGDYGEHHGEYRVDNDVGYYYEQYVNKYYEGRGVIFYKSKKYSFTFAKKVDKEKSLEEIIFDFKEFTNDSINPRLIDLVLKNILSEISESKEIIPDISLPEINYDELVNYGMLPDKNGQLYLQFPI